MTISLQELYKKKKEFFFFFWIFEPRKPNFIDASKKKNFFVFDFKKLLFSCPVIRRFQKITEICIDLALHLFSSFEWKKSKGIQKKTKKKNLQPSCCAWFSPPKCLFCFFGIFRPLKKRPTCLTDSLLFKRNSCKRIESISEWLPLKRNLLKKRKKQPNTFETKFVYLFLFVSFNFGQAPSCLIHATDCDAKPLFFWKKQKLFAFRNWQKY